MMAIFLMQINVIFFLLFLLKTIDRGYTLEPKEASLTHDLRFSKNNTLVNPSFTI